MPYHLLLSALWAREYQMFFEIQVDRLYPRYWPSADQADDSMLACMGCPL